MTELRGFPQVQELAADAKARVERSLQLHKSTPSLIKIEAPLFDALVRTSHAQLDASITKFAYNHAAGGWEIFGVPCEKSRHGSGIRIFYRCCRC